MICYGRNLGLLVAFATMAASDAHALENESGQSMEEAFAARFPETAPDEITCEGFGPLCEIVAGRTVFYVDQTARHAFIGRVYDLEAKEDLTEATLKRLTPAASAPVSQLSWDQLPFGSAIVRNRGGALKVAVFSDLNCGYCRNLSAALETAPDIEAHEFLIGMAGSEAASRAVGCADDPEAAIAAYYRNHTIPDASCDRDVVSPARAAAQSLGPAMGGTPTFMRPDGAVMSGFRDIDALRDWLQAGEVDAQ